jgi:hypothetical protein
MRRGRYIMALSHVGRFNSMRFAMRCSPCRYTGLFALLALIFGLSSSPARAQDAPGSLDRDCNSGQPLVLRAVAASLYAAATKLPDNTFAIVGGDSTSPSLKTFPLTADCSLASPGLTIEPRAGAPSLFTTGIDPKTGDKTLYSVSIDTFGAVQIAKQVEHAGYATAGSVHGLDPGFGSQGIAKSNLGDPNALLTGIEVTRNGTIFVQGIGVGGLTGYTFVVKVQADGTPDLTFGQSGVARTAFPGMGFAGYGMAVDPVGGGVFIAGAAYRTSTPEFALVQLNAQGTAFTIFGGPMPALYAFGGTGEIARHVRYLPTGDVIVVGTSEGNVIITKINPNDGSIYKAVKVASTQLATVNIDVAAKPVEIILAKTSVVDATYQPSLDRYFLDGNAITKDTVWSSSALSDFNGIIRSLSKSDDGKFNVVLQLSTAAKALPTTFNYAFMRLVGDSIPGTVTEFHNSILGHFFVTANAEEATAIDGGSAGPGWSRTGLTFKSGGRNRVCRFYGTPGVGPNSHFYTDDPAECGQVKFDPGWHFEDYDFSSSPPTNGLCGAGKVPVYRAYNNGFAQNNSNHRLTISFDAYSAQLAAGWKGEGVVMCAPQ